MPPLDCSSIQFSDFSFMRTSPLAHKLVAPAPACESGIPTDVEELCCGALRGQCGVQFVKRFERALLNEPDNLTRQIFLRENHTSLRTFREQFNGDARRGWAEIDIVNDFRGFTDFLVDTGEHAVAVGMASDVHFGCKRAALTEIAFAHDIGGILASGPALQLCRFSPSGEDPLLWSVQCARNLQAIAGDLYARFHLRCSFPGAESLSLRRNSSSASNW